MVRDERSGFGPTGVGAASSVSEPRLLTGTWRRVGRSVSPVSRRRPLDELPDAELLKLRLCDLKLTLTPLRPAIKQLYDELAAKGLRFRPHVWLSHGFFAEDSLRGFAVPFYLAHPRLMALERRMMIDVEAGTHDWCLRILRHEAGHAIDNATRLHERPGYRMLFGSFHEPYPESYRPDIASRDFVLHLDCWYAQSHPAEDFAETFAVWLSPTSDWRAVYAGWGALAKLHWVDAAMRELSRRPIPAPTLREHKPLRKLTWTLAEHYAERRALYQRRYPTVPRRDLARLFRTGGRRDFAAPWLRRWKPMLRLTVSRWTGLPQLTLEMTLADLIHVCRRRRLRLTRSPDQTRHDLVALLAACAQTFLADARHPIPL